LDRSAAPYRHREAALAAVAIQAFAQDFVAYGFLRFARNENIWRPVLGDVHRQQDLVLSGQDW
jgi:hypothetical protein